MVGTIVVVAGGARPEPTAVQLFLSSLPPVRHIVGVDSGIDHARALGLSVDSAVGDMDSVSDQGRQWIEQNLVAIDEHPAEKDKTDLELGIDKAAAVARTGSDEGETLLAFLAISGDRTDHVLANLQVIAGHRTKSFAVRALLDDSVMSVVGGTRTESSVELSGRPGDRVSIHPMGGSARAIFTSGLVYPLNDECLSAGTARGVSNVFADATATVSVGSGTAIVLQELVHDRPGGHDRTLDGGELDAHG